VGLLLGAVVTEGIFILFICSPDAVTIRRKDGTSAAALKELKM
jgi:hypothetical protein